MVTDTDEYKGRKFTCDNCGYTVSSDAKSDFDVDDFNFCPYCGMNNNEELLNAERWIPCSDRLPECEDYAETDALLFQLHSGTIEIGYFGRKNAWRDAYFRHYRTPCGVDVSNVFAWMPLPEPYKGE